MMNKYYTSAEYTVSPHSIKFDPEMVEFNRIQTDEEYQATKASIAKFGQLTPIAVNDKTGMGEDGRHRARACMELGTDVICRQVNGELDKATRLGLYNVDAMSGRDLTPAQKAIQAHKFIKMSNQTIAEGAMLFKASTRNVSDANTIAGLGRSDILDTISRTGEWTRPSGGLPIKSLRTIASELRATTEELEVRDNKTNDIDYESMINTEKGKSRFWELRTVMQMSQHEATMILVKMLNYEYVLKVNKVTGEIDER